MGWWLDRGRLWVENVAVRGAVGARFTGSDSFVAVFINVRSFATCAMDMWSPVILFRASVLCKSAKAFSAPGVGPIRVLRAKARDCIRNMLMALSMCAATSAHRVALGTVFGRLPMNSVASLSVPLTTDIICAKLAVEGSPASVSHDSGVASGATKLEICASEYELPVERKEPPD